MTMVEFIATTELTWLLIVFAAFIAGIFNALAGGGTFFILPILLALGVPPVQASVTSASSLWSGYLSSSYQYRQRIWQQKKHLYYLLGIAFLGSVSGSFILINTSNLILAKLIPFLILLATILFASNGKLHIDKSKPYGKLALVSYFLVCLYGGFFGAGMGIIIMATLPLFGIVDMQDNLALKHTISLTISLVSLCVFAWYGYILWKYMLLGLIGASVGGLLGAKISQKINNTYLVYSVVTVGLGLSVYYFIIYWL